MAFLISMKLKKNTISKNINSICILLTDDKSINQIIILKTFKNLKKMKFINIYFIGDKNLFKKIYKFCKTQNDKFIFVDIRNKNNFKYLNDITLKGISLFEEKKIKFIINMPLCKKKFLKNRFSGFTEFFSEKLDNKNDENMILFNKNFSVCPITTHIKISEVENKINKKKLMKSIDNIIQFISLIKNKKINIILLGLNPHASKDMEVNNKDYSIISPIVKKYKKIGVKIKGPVSADTAFIDCKNKIFIGMYHDQVLIPFKTLNKFDGINITIGKKIIRLSPDHGVATELLSKPKQVNNLSFLRCLQFCEKY